MGRIYQFFGIACVLLVFWYCWKQCLGLKFKRSLIVALLLSFIFITIHYKDISNPAAVYLTVGLVGIPALVYGSVFSYEMLLIITAIYIPFNAILPVSFGGTQKALNGTNIILFALIFGYIGNVVKGMRVPSSDKISNKLVIVFSMLVMYSYIRGGIYHGGSYLTAFLDEMKRFMEVIIIYLVFMKSIQNKSMIKILFSICLIVVVMAVYLGLLEWINLGFATYSGFRRRLGGLNMQPNSFGAFVAFYGFLFLAQFIVNCRRADARFMIFPFLLGLRVLIPTNSRGAWIAFPPGLLTLAFVRSKLFLVGVVLSLVLPFVFIPSLIPETVKYRFAAAAERDRAEEMYASPEGLVEYLSESREISMRTRARLLIGGIKLWKTNPWFGYGYGTFPFLIANYTEWGTRGDPHNFILQILCEMGVITLGALVAVMGIFFRAGLYVFRHEKDLFLKGFALGYLAIIPALLAANLTGNRFTHTDLLGIFWMLSACIVRLMDIIKLERRSEGLS